MVMVAHNLSVLKTGVFLTLVCPTFSKLQSSCIFPIRLSVDYSSSSVVWLKVAISTLTRECPLPNSTTVHRKVIPIECDSKGSGKEDRNIHYYLSRVKTWISWMQSFLLANQLQIVGHFMALIAQSHILTIQQWMILFQLEKVCLAYWPLFPALLPILTFIFWNIIDLFHLMKRFRWIWFEIVTLDLSVKSRKKRNKPFDFFSDKIFSWADVKKLTVTRSL